MTRILDDRDSHALVQHDDGTVELIPWSPLNTLVYRHGLDGLLVTGDDVLHWSADETGSQDILIRPTDGATEFDFSIGDETFHIAQHEKSDLIDVLLDAYDERGAGSDAVAHGALIEYAGRLMDTDVNPTVVDRLVEHPHFADAVERTSKGWRINGHVLLTYDNEFYHPNTTRKTQSGGIVDDGANKSAYDLRFEQAGQTELTDLGDFGATESEVEFISRAIWAVTYTGEVSD